MGLQRYEGALDTRGGGTPLWGHISFQGVNEGGESHI